MTSSSSAAVTASASSATPSTTTPPVTTTVPPRDELDLPLVPWEGGPKYYGQFAKAGAWTDPNFFPVAVWGATVGTQEDVDLDKAVGINTYLELYDTPRLDLIRKAGMFALHDQTTNPHLGSETVGWLLADEPEQFGQGDALNLLRANASALPNDGRMRYTNFTANMIWPNYAPEGETAEQWLDVNSAASLDTYWYGRYMGCDRLSYPDLPALNQSLLTEAECYRPFNYGYGVTKQREIAASSGKMESVFGFVENGRPYAENAAIKPDQLRGSVMSMLIHGARGINYFNHTYGDWCTSSNNFRYTAQQGGDCYAEMTKAATKVNGQIKALAPVLNTQSYQWELNPSLDTMLKLHDGNAYVFAMGKGIPGGTATGSFDLTLPADVRGTSVEVVDEGRTIPVVSGKFTDTFASDTTYHIYKVRA
ncbi:putative secreted protein [Saccharothrix espanaensis DSM 44229]|uniref:Putative secreted protein n=1 Tax=Saccharothrix espanaensis (strain ATCC 51144 / DSM 44229 / JCM 9112 / NBRC 15066 / NRRL 15764) TaxID=1179773 RepID=K0JZX5_SACES|nr:putative secreted protein [Saccharothrix espanaensis DSM 44229]